MVQFGHDGLGVVDQRFVRREAAQITR